MPWPWFQIAVIILLGSLLVMRGTRMRDLHRAPSRQIAVLRWARLTGVGLTFYGFIHLVALLRIYGWPGPGSTPDMIFWLMIGVIGLSLWFILSEAPRPAENYGRTGRGA